jgi:hypothetical protein
MMKGNMTCQTNVLQTVTLTYKDCSVQTYGNMAMVKWKLFLTKYRKVKTKGEYEIPIGLK